MRRISPIFRVPAKYGKIIDFLSLSAKWANVLFELPVSLRLAFTEEPVTGEMAIDFFPQQDRLLARLADWREGKIGCSAAWEIPVAATLNNNSTVNNRPIPKNENAGDDIRQRILGGKTDGQTGDAQRAFEDALQ